MIIARPDDLQFSSLPGRWSADPFAGGAEAAGMSLRVVRISSDGPRAPHRHPRSAEAVYVAEGRGRAWVDGEVAPVTAGDAFLVPRGVPHATVPEDGAQLLLVCFFPDDDLATNTEELPGDVTQAARGSAG